METDDRCCGSWRPHDRDGHGIEEEEEEEQHAVRFRRQWMVTRVVSDMGSLRALAGGPL